MLEAGRGKGHEIRFDLGKVALELPLQLGILDRLFDPGRFGFESFLNPPLLDGSQLGFLNVPKGRVMDQFNLISNSCLGAARSTFRSEVAGSE